MLIPRCAVAQHKAKTYLHIHGCGAPSLLTFCPHFPPPAHFSRPSSFFFCPFCIKNGPRLLPQTVPPSCCLPRPPIKALPSRDSLVQRPRDSWGTALLGSNTDVHTVAHPREHVLHPRKGNAVMLATQHVCAFYSPKTCVKCTRIFMIHQFKHIYGI